MILLFISLTPLSKELEGDLFLCVQNLLFILILCALKTSFQLKVVGTFHDNVIAIMLGYNLRYRITLYYGGETFLPLKVIGSSLLEPLSHTKVIALSKFEPLSLLKVIVLVS